MYVFKSNTKHPFCLEHSCLACLFCCELLVRGTQETSRGEKKYQADIFKHRQLSRQQQREGKSRWDSWRAAVHMLGEVPVKFLKSIPQVDYEHV